MRTVVRWLVRQRPSHRGSCDLAIRQRQRYQRGIDRGESAAGAAVPAVKDTLALAAAAVWFSVNIVLWVVVETAMELFGWSVAMGVVYFTGFFGYLGYRDTRRP
jgi:hypothetical protein